MKTLLALSLSLSLFSAGSLAQTLTIPSQTFIQPVTVNGTTLKITITVPAQTIPLPASGGAGLPSGLTFSNGVFAVAGSISASSVSLTGGSALPVCASASYLLSPVSAGSTTLQPSCYVPPASPAITVSQAASPINTLTFTSAP